MSQSAPETETENPTVDPADETEAEGDEPEIEDDLFEEELRIDGICGVY